MDVGEACRLTKSRDCGHVTCFYCDRSLDHHHQHDHFPIPKVAKGTEVVPTCLDCHDLKDRHPLMHWHINAFLEALQGLLANALDVSPQPPSTPDLTWLATAPALTDQAILDRWGSLLPLSRIMYAKLRSVHEEGQHRARVRAAAAGDPPPASQGWQAFIANSIAEHGTPALRTQPQID